MGADSTPIGRVAYKRKQLRDMFSVGMPESRIAAYLSRACAALTNYPVDETYAATDQLTRRIGEER